MRRFFRLLPLLLAAFLLGGCMTIKQSFPERDPDTVWTALVSVAKAPDYSGPRPEDRWSIEQNHVAVYEEDWRIEIYRILRRTLYRPGAKPVRQKQEWRVRVVLNPDEPPTAEFTSRGWAVPIKARTEAERYFADVSTILSGSFPGGALLEPGVETPSTEPSPDDWEEYVPPPDDVPPAETDPIIDLDDLEPDDG